MLPFDPKRNHRGIMMQPHVRWPFPPTSSAHRYPSGNKATFHWTGDGFRGLPPVWRL